MDRTIETPAGFKIEFDGFPKHDYYIDGEKVPVGTEMSEAW